jgi:hypothetical protein
VYGQATRTVEVTLPPGDLTDKDKESEARWVPPQVVPRGQVRRASLRDPATAAAAAPTDLLAAVMHPNGIRFTWTDHATDEEGFLLEVRPAGSREFGTAAVLDPNVNSFGLITLPTEKQATYRLRAFYYGRPSNVAHRRTGPEPSAGADATPKPKP